MRTKTEQPAVAFNATKDDDDLLEKKSVIFCWLTEITLSLHPGKATANQQTHHFWCEQKLSNLRSHSTRRKMMMGLLEKKSVIFCWLTEITLSLNPGKATANQVKLHHFWCEQKLSNLRSHSTRRKMMMIYLKRRVSSFADSLKSLYPFIQGKQPQIRQTHHFWCGQKLSNLRSHSTRRKMMMIYLKRRVSSFAD